MQNCLFVTKRYCASFVFFMSLLAVSVVFGEVRVPGGDIKLENGDLRISGTSKGIVFSDSSVQTTAAPSGLKTVLNGPGDPLASQGEDGDFYINTVSSRLFGPKTLGVWPTPGVSLVGPQGVKGDTGPQGSPGVGAPRSPVMNTGLKTTYGEGDDGYWSSGVTIPSTIRFTDNLVNGVSNGTITDNMTGLVWLKNANCSATLGGVVNTGTGLTWPNALTWTNNLASGSCGLTDGSLSKQWRLPNRTELMSLVDYTKASPALPTGHLFSGVQSNYYWTGSTVTYYTDYAWAVSMSYGRADYSYKSNNGYSVWPVRAGQ